MTPDLGYHQPDDIGGPMNLGEEYRRTVPVVTYGFDPSFLDYFGQPGVDTIEQAIQTLNDLPPASELVLTNYPLSSMQINYYAAGGARISMISSLSRCLCCLSRWGWPSPRVTFGRCDNGIRRCSAHLVPLSR